MSAQEFAIAHGEKILVVTITGLCGWMLWNTFDNQDIRPRDISAERITEMVGKVEKVRGEVVSPVLKAPSNYLDDMKARWASGMPSNEYFSWLSTTIDVGPIDVDVLRVYIYELHAPQVVQRLHLGRRDGGTEECQAPLIADPQARCNRPLAQASDPIGAPTPC